MKVSSIQPARAAVSRSTRAARPAGPSFSNYLEAQVSGAANAASFGTNSAQTLGAMQQVMGSRTPTGVGSAARQDPPLHPMDSMDFVPGSHQSPRDQHDRAVASAQKWVAQTFFGTLMRQMRNSPFKSELFEGGRGGQAFTTLFDQRIVDHMSRSADKKLVGAITRKILGKKQGSEFGTAGSANAQQPSTGNWQLTTGNSSFELRTQDSALRTQH